MRAMQYRGRNAIITIGLLILWGCKIADVKSLPAPAPKRNFSMVMEKARELYKLGEFAKAMEIAEGLIQIDQEDAFFHELKGEILLDMGKYQEAIASFQKAEKLNPKAYTAYLREGFTHELLHEEKETIECLRRGIEIFRDLPPEKGLSDDILFLTEQATRRILELLPPVKIAVLNFEGDYETTANNYNRFIPWLLVKKLAKQKRIRVRDPRRQSKFLEKYSLGMSGVTKTEEGLRIGRLLEVDWMIMGMVYQDADSFQIELRLIKVSTGVIVYEDIIPFTSHADAESRCEEIANKIVVHTI